MPDQELLVQMFLSMCEQLGEEQAVMAIKNNETFRDHSTPLRNRLEDDIAYVQMSRTAVDKQLTDFRSAVSEGLPDNMAVFNDLIDLVLKATPETITYLQQFGNLLTSLTNHIADYSANRKLQRLRTLKKVLDEMLATAQSPAHVGASTKRKNDELAFSTARDDGMSKMSRG
jgi:hypothetical protein